MEKNFVCQWNFGVIINSAAVFKSIRKSVKDQYRVLSFTANSRQSIPELMYTSIEGNRRDLKLAARHP
jgi:hypothetical protein